MVGVLAAGDVRVGGRHLTRRLEQDLLAAGQRVVRVSTRLMAAGRRGTRRPGKSDPIDAERLRGSIWLSHSLVQASGLVGLDYLSTCLNASS
jgi:hypothetical protein